MRPEFAKQCFFFTSKGRTFLDRTVRRPIPSRTADDPYNRPPWVQEYVREGHDLPDAETQAKSWAGYSPDRFTLPVIGVVSKDGKYLAALANGSASGMCQAWHDCLHNNSEWRLQGGSGSPRVWRLKVYAMANDPSKLLARVAKDFPDLRAPRSVADGAPISFHVENDLDISHPEVAVKGGVPLPRGEARPDDHFVVTDIAGKEVPAQVNVTGFWPDGSVKWLLVILPTPLEPRSRRELRLEVRPTGRPAPEVHAIARQDDDAIHVNTGTMEFSVSKRRPGLFQRLALMADGKTETVIDADHTAGLFVEVARGDPDFLTGARTRFEANAEQQGFTATLEEAGPQRAVICLRGIHVSSSGERFGNYTMRIYAHAGSSQIRLVHSFIYTGDPQNDFVRSIGLRIKPALGALQSYTLGGERGPGITTAHNEDPEYPIWQKAVLSQDSALHYSVRKWVDPGRNRAVTLSQGRRSQGWGDISGERATVMVGIRNFWQEYPKAIEVDAQQREIVAYLYSPYGEPLDLRRYSDRVYSKAYETSSNTMPFFEHEFGARYIGKTSELLLDFQVRADRERAARESHYFQSPPLLTAEMAWIAKTRALGDFAAAGENADPRVTARVREISDFLMREQDARNWYSFVDYGDVVHSYDPERDLWRSDQGGYAWNNNEAMIVEAMWSAYLHTGDPKLFRFAEAMTRHSADVDMYQMGPLAGHGTRHNVNHWGCMDKERRMTVPANKRIFYFLTGDEHVRDQVKLIYDTICDEPLTKGSMDIGVGGYAALFLWETTGEARYREIVRSTSESFCAARVEGKGFPRLLDLDFRTGRGKAYEGKDQGPQSGWFLLLFGPMYFLVDSVELTESPAVGAALLEWASLLKLSDAEFRKIQPNTQEGDARYLETMRTLAYAYRMTGDPSYRSMIEKGLNVRLGRFEKLGGSSPLQAEEHRVYRLGSTPNELENAHTYYLSQSLLPLPYGLAVLAHQGSARR